MISGRGGGGSPQLISPFMILRTLQGEACLLEVFFKGSNTQAHPLRHPLLVDFSWTNSSKAPGVSSGMLSFCLMLVRWSSIRKRLISSACSLMAAAILYTSADPPLSESPILLGAHTQTHHTKKNKNGQKTA